MKLISRKVTDKAARETVGLLAFVLSGGLILSACATARPNIDPTAFEKMSCPELDEAIGAMAKSITQIAIRRGETANLSIPNWLPGVPATVTAVNERRTARIEGLKSEQEAMMSARARQCSA